jgi:hypothetical protein
MPQSSGSCTLATVLYGTDSRFHPGLIISWNDTGPGIVVVVVVAGSVVVVVEVVVVVVTTVIVFCPEPGQA